MDDDSYTVSFVKKNNDGSYCWPDKDDRSTMLHDKMVLVKSPSIDISTTAGAQVVGIKLLFDPSDIGTDR